MNLGDIKVQVGIDTTRFNAGLAQAKQQAEQFARTVGSQAQVLESARQAMANSTAVTLSNAEKSRQLTAASKELATARAKLAEIMGGESQIAQQVAARYSTLQNVQRAQLIEVKEAIAGFEAEAKAQQVAAAAAVKAQEQKIEAAGKAALANKAAAEVAIKAAEAEVDAEIKAALAAGRTATAVEEAAAKEVAASQARLRVRVPVAGGTGISTGIGGGVELLAAGAIAGALAEAVKQSVAFNKEMANVAAVSGSSAQQIAQLKTSVQNLAVETGKDTGDLAKGLYQVISAFGNTADSAKILAINTKLAIGGVSSTEAALKLTSAVTKAYGDTSAVAVKHVADLALETVKLGQTRLPELAAAMGKTIPLAAQLKVGQDQLFGAMATGAGVTGNVNQVSTQLRGILQSLLAPTKQMSALFKEAGVSSGEALIQQRGLQGAIQLIVETASRADEPLAKYIKRIEGQTLAYSLAGPQAEKLTEKTRAMKTASGELERALEAQQNGVNKLGAEWSKLKQLATVSAQNFGELLTPAVLKATEAVEHFLGAVRRAGEAHGKWMTTPQGPSVFGMPNPNAAPEPGLAPTPENMRGLLLGPAGRSSPLFRPYGPPVPAGLGAGAAGPTKDQLDAHAQIVSTLAAQQLDTLKAKTAQLYGEQSKQMGALDLYGKSWDQLTAAQQKNAAQYEANIKAEMRAKDAIDAGKDAVKQRQKAEEQAAAQRQKQQEEYQRFLKEQQVGTRVAIGQPGAGLAQFRLDHPDFSAQQAQVAYNAEQWKKHHEALAQEARDQEEVDQRLRDTMNDQLKQARLDADSALAKRKYGEVNRESLAIDSQWQAHYAELSPRQQRVIDQLYQLALAKKLNDDMDKAFETDAKARIKAYDDEQKAIDKQTEANYSLQKAMAERQRQADKDKQKVFDEQLKDAGEKLNKAADQAQDRLNQVADQVQGVFENAFQDAFNHGPKAFFKGVVQGFEQMLQQMAARYLASQIAGLIFGRPNENGDRSGGGIGGVLGGFLGGILGARAGGGSVMAGASYMVGERGPELFSPREAGMITSNGQLAGAGGPNIVIHVHGVTDAQSFRKNTGAITADMERALRVRSRRDG